MNELSHDRNEQDAASAFSRQAPLFDQYDAGNTIIQYKRRRVRDCVMQCLAPGSTILELNAGTGQDSIWLAGKGHKVHATDIAPGMLAELEKKVNALGLAAQVTWEPCSFTQLAGLRSKGPYDLIFSNFAGLNCTGKLDEVLNSFSGLLKPGGHVLLVVLPSFCLWESLLLFRGKFRTAFRRLFAKKGARSRVEGVYFKCWYYPPSYITRVLARSFTLKGLEGLCSIVPPSYIEQFAERHPKLYHWLVKKEDRWKSSRPWRSIGDYYIITLQKTEDHSAAK
ncbi:MAG: class I SAM-dependent methyltransferase [Bacteroidota bacterium]|nr:class I SAM-dependent methyltransferase [Bacteroidota bacterium]MDP4215978.1 class I SAM-dependent methyltransferase [Bacteroidota bacterium]MDP4245099.1 class I SAM-dependent methyltransferase [Bacteroidota bacterium]MDP4252531.1 class I SAM-dependent methyltransferase [Bacteroidota bacterium]MDP4257833.1 class I SAM-dependent methyltransferase [Bacteroidota bacterium]